MIIKFYSKIKRIEHRKKLVRAWKEGDQTRTEQEDMGWFMVLEGSWEALYIGSGEPEGLQIDDEVEVIIRPRTDAEVAQ
jgi:hypothetical protein